MTTAIVIGAGIFGTTVARWLHRGGTAVTHLDARRPNAGTPPSAFLMKPSWLGRLARADIETSQRILDQLYGLDTVTFSVGVMGRRLLTQTAERVRADAVLRDAQHATTTAEVVRVEPSTHGGALVTLRDATEPPLWAPLVVVAAGIWTSALLPTGMTPEQVGKVGVSWRGPGQLEVNRIEPWAPYKQLVAFNETSTSVWAGDGSAILAANWTATRQEASRVRVAARLVPEVAQGLAPCVGVRPVAKLAAGCPCVCEERSPGLWVVTGGGKNGTVAAGWAAARIAGSL